MKYSNVFRVLWEWITVERGSSASSVGVSAERWLRHLLPDVTVVKPLRRTIFAPNFEFSLSFYFFWIHYCEIGLAGRFKEFSWPGRIRNSFVHLQMAFHIAMGLETESEHLYCWFYFQFLQILIDAGGVTFTKKRFRAPRTFARKCENVSHPGTTETG